MKYRPKCLLCLKVKKAREPVVFTLRISALSCVCFVTLVHSLREMAQPVIPTSSPPIPFTLASFQQSEGGGVIKYFGRIILLISLPGVPPTSPPRSLLILDNVITLRPKRLKLYYSY